MFACERPLHNPKRSAENRRGKAGWYEYYAGFSPAFVRDAIRLTAAGQHTCILDPWNGSGTTTDVCAEEGLRCIGFDLNPAMVLVARARLIDLALRPSLRSICDDLLVKAKRATGLFPSDPLLSWFKPETAATLRRFDKAIQDLLVPRDARTGRVFDGDLDHISSLAAFYYVAGFRTIKSLLRQFQSSNPTWLRAPSDPEERIAESADRIHMLLRKNVESMIGAVEDEHTVAKPCKVRVARSASTQLPLDDETIDSVITSPPYCTRIDYVRKTSPELALLGARSEQLKHLRDSMIGTPTIKRLRTSIDSAWGPHCCSLIEQIASHNSYAAKSYYTKTYVQYFDGMYRSFDEINRTLRRGGEVIIVIQDSYFKDIHIDLVRVITEMVSPHGWEPTLRADFRAGRSFASVNPYANQNGKSSTETVVGFRKHFEKKRDS